MKKNNLTKFSWISLLIIITVFSVLIAGIFYRYNSVISRGIIGGVTLCLLYYFGRHTKMDVSTKEFLKDTRKGKYFIAALFVPMISYWSAAQIYEMILFIKTLGN